MASPSDWIQVSRQAGGLAVLSMAREPVNMLSLEMWAALHEALQGLEADAQTRGVVITTGLKRPVFTAGHDIKELYAPLTSRERYRRFWDTVNTCLSCLYRSPLVTIAAVRGYCPAAGCAIAMCCDYRLVTPGVRIGLNEVELGIPVPRFWGDLMGRLVGPGTASRLCLFSVMLPALEAAEAKLVDEVVGEDKLLSRAEEVARAVLRFPDAGRQASKGLMRDEFSAQWQRHCREVEADFAFDRLSQPDTVAGVKAILEGLSKRKASKL